MSTRPARTATGLRPVAIAAALAAVILPPLARADWPTSGKFVTRVDDSFNTTRLARIFDLPAGDILVLSVGSGGLSNGYSLQRISPTGDIAPGWAANGLPIGELVKTQYPRLQGFALDDSACLWWAAYGLSSGRPSARMVRPDAVELPSSSTGWPGTTGTSSVLGVTAAPAMGGSYVAWSGRVQRLTRSGAPATGWPTTGVFGIVDEEPAAQSDGAGGVVLYSSRNLLAQRIDANGVRHAGWLSAGLALGTNPPNESSDFSETILDPLQPSGPDHFIAGWTTTPKPPAKVKLVRFSLDATVDPAWPAGGLLAVTPDTISGVTFLPDGLGGVHVLWYAHGRPLGTHVQSDGTFVPGLGPSGVDLAGSDPNFVFPKRGGASPAPINPLEYVVAGSAPNGGLLFAYEDGSLAPTVRYRVRWLDADYTPDSSEPAEGRLVVPSTRPSSVRAVHADGAGGAYLAWEVLPIDFDHQLDFELWMTRLLSSSFVGVPPGVTRAATLTLSAPRPNPVRDAAAFELTLPDDSPARVELLDVAGRVLRSQSVAGAGPHTVAFDDLGSLPPGLYFARATNRSGERCVRVVIAK